MVDAMAYLASDARRLHERVRWDGTTASAGRSGFATTPLASGACGWALPMTKRRGRAMSSEHPASRTPTASGRRSGSPSVGPTACASISGADPTKIRVRFGSCDVLGEGDIRPNADAGAPRRGSGPPPPRRGAALARNRGAARRVRRDGPPAHLDGHLNMHLLLPILRELAPRYDIRAMRLSREGGVLRARSAPRRVQRLRLLRLRQNHRGRRRS